MPPSLCDGGGDECDGENEFHDEEATDGALLGPADGQLREAGKLPFVGDYRRAESCRGRETARTAGSSG